MTMQCNVCSKPFKNSQGVSLHKLRSTCGGKIPAWGTTLSKKRQSTAMRARGTNGESGREAIRAILTNHPPGLPTKEIFDALKERGFKQLNANYVSQAVAGDPILVATRRGFYCIKKQRPRKQPIGVATVQEAVDEADAGLTHMPREALLLRIETLEAQSKALQDAHVTLLRGAFV